LDNAPPKSKKGYFARAYHGEERLVSLFWWYGFWVSFAASLSLNLAISVAPYQPGEDFFRTILINPLFLVPVGAGWVAAHVWFFRSIWTSADNTNDPKWGKVAKACLFVAGPAWLPFLFANVLWQAFILMV